MAKLQGVVHLKCLSENTRWGPQDQHESVDPPSLFQRLIIFSKTARFKHVIFGELSLRDFLVLFILELLNYIEISSSRGISIYSPGDCTPSYYWGVVNSIFPLISNKREDTLSGASISCQTKELSSSGSFQIQHKLWNGRLGQKILCCVTFQVLHTLGHPHWPPPVHQLAILLHIPIHFIPVKWGLTPSLFRKIRRDQWPVTSLQPLGQL